MEILGPRAADFMRLMRERYVHHCTRIDVAHDYEGPNAFQELNEVFEATKTKFDVYGQKAGDWDQPRFGLTRTLGSRGSNVRVQLYMKGRHPDCVHHGRPDWVRVELRVRPVGAAAKRRFSSCSLEEAWGANRWTRHLANLLFGLDIPSLSPRKPSKRTDGDRVIYNLLMRCHKRFEESAVACGGWDKLGLELGVMTNEIKRRHSQP